MTYSQDIPNGKAAAALIAGGIGIALIGIFTTLTEAVPVFRSVLILDGSVGPLSGISTLPMVLWLVIWLGLDIAWKGKDLDFGKVVIASRTLLGVGLLGTFPLFYKLFTGG